MVFRETFQSRMQIITIFYFVFGQEGTGVPELMKDMVGVRIGGNVRDCNSLVGEVLWPETGECVTLLTQGPCQPGQWVKLGNQDREYT